MSILFVLSSPSYIFVVPAKYCLTICLVRTFTLDKIFLFLSSPSVSVYLFKIKLFGFYLVVENKEKLPNCACNCKYILCADSSSTHIHKYIYIFTSFLCIIYSYWYLFYSFFFGMVVFGWLTQYLLDWLLMMVWVFLLNIFGDKRKNPFR